MNMYRLGLALSLVVAAACAARAEQAATVKGDRVNVRGKASLNSEAIFQLSVGEKVTVLEEVAARNPKKGEPARWAKIVLPANVPIFVFAPYIDPEEKVVKVNRLNLRSGPGEEFSILGRIERGTTVKELRTTGNWMEIEAPADAYGFVAMEYLELAPPTKPETGPATSPTAQPETTPVATTQPTDTPLPVEVEPAPVVVPVENPSDTTAATPTDTGTEDQTTVAPVTTIETVPVATEPPVAPRRVVIREGRVVYSRSIQAPSKWALESLENHKLINYLHTELEGLDLKAFSGRKVFVTGEELLDARWTRIPLLEVEDVQVAP